VSDCIRQRASIIHAIIPTIFLTNQNKDIGPIVCYMSRDWTVVNYIKLHFQAVDAHHWCALFHYTKPSLKNIPR